MALDCDVPCAKIGLDDVLLYRHVEQLSERVGGFRQDQSMFELHPRFPYAGVVKSSAFVGFGWLAGRLVRACKSLLMLLQ